MEIIKTIRCQIFAAAVLVTVPSMVYAEQCVENSNKVKKIIDYIGVSIEQENAAAAFRLSRSFWIIRSMIPKCDQVEKMAKLLEEINLGENEKEKKFTLSGIAPGNYNGGNGSRTGGKTIINGIPVSEINKIIRSQSGNNGVFRFDGGVIRKVD